MTTDTSIICQQPGRYIGWPSIAKTLSGELLITFCGDRDNHVCPFGKIFLIRSADNDKTWSEPEPTGIIGKPAHLMMSRWQA